jgi:hypothetical protein
MASAVTARIAISQQKNKTNKTPGCILGQLFSNLASENSELLTKSGFGDFKF